ncbi:hypothetical protein NQZ68_020650 [Dissostichus eleginoides]|nr:hypothetical protein NQZ68_020650 [Dissostichus eleginoides]
MVVIGWEGGTDTDSGQRCYGLQCLPTRSVIGWRSIPTPPAPTTHLPWQCVDEWVSRFVPQVGLLRRGGAAPGAISGQTASGCDLHLQASPGSETQLTGNMVSAFHPAGRGGASGRRSMGRAVSAELSALKQHSGREVTESSIPPERLSVNSTPDRAAKVKVRSIPEQDRGAIPELR